MVNDKMPSKIIIHVGAPKCGSSTLQSALSMSPTLTSPENGKFAYYGLLEQRSDWRPVKGSVLRKLSKFASTGYMSCPNFARTLDHAKIARGLDQIYQTAKPGLTPIISQEGWYNRAEYFQELLPHWFSPSTSAPQIEVVAFVRPHIDWLNSAYWQWGVWSHGTWESWIQKSLIDYRVGACLTQWAALPNVKLRVHLGGDVIDNFNGQYDVSLTRPKTSNVSQSPALIGFMQRNPKFRESAHDVTAEFAFQRWCNTENMQRPWALRPRDVQPVLAPRDEDFGKLLALLPEEERARVTCTDPRWTQLHPYYDRLAKGPSDLGDVPELAELYARLCSGVVLAAAAAKKTVPEMPEPPKFTDSIDTWDIVFAQVFDALIKLDDASRLGPLSAAKNWFKVGHEKLSLKG